MDEKPVPDRPLLLPIALLALIVLLGLYVLFKADDTLIIAVHQGVEGVPVTKLADKFSLTYHVAVEVVDLPYRELYEAEVKAVDPKEKEKPRFDVMMLDDPWLPALIGDSDKPQLAELDKVDCARLDVEDFVPSTLQVSLHPTDPKARPTAAGSEPGPFTCNDRFYALPIVGNSQLFLTHGQRPATWADVAKSSTTDDRGYVLRAGTGNSIVTDFMPILWSVTDAQRDVQAASYAPRPLDMLNLDRERTLEAFRVLADLGQRPRAHRSVVSVDDFDLTIHVVQRQASMSIVWTAWMMAIWKLPEPYRAQLLTGAGRPDTGQLQVMQVPGTSHALGAWLLAIPERTASAKKKLAREFMLYATNKENLLQAAKEGNPPPRRSVFKDPDLQGQFEWLDKQLQSLRFARPRPRMPQWRQVEDLFGDCLSALYDGALDVETTWTRLNVGLEPFRRSVADKPLRRVADRVPDKFNCVPSRR